MQYPLFDVEPTGTGGRWTSKLAHFPTWTYLIFQVIGPSIAFLARDRQTLLQDTQFGRQGLQINQAAGIQKYWWRGDLWVSASAPMAFEFIAQELTEEESRRMLPVMLSASSF